jgi:hypothetical protein
MLFSGVKFDIYQATTRRMNAEFKYVDSYPLNITYLTPYILEIHYTRSASVKIRPSPKKNVSHTSDYDDELQ